VSARYLTKDDDTVDLIAWNYYGRQDRRIVERVLEANFGLADHGPILPAGILVILPELDADTQQDASDAVKLWD
jgi:phage tail protein X